MPSLQKNQPFWHCFQLFIQTVEHENGGLWNSFCSFGAISVAGATRAAGRATQVTEQLFLLLVVCSRRAVPAAYGAVSLELLLKPILYLATSKAGRGGPVDGRTAPVAVEVASAAGGLCLVLAKLFLAVAKLFLAVAKLFMLSAKIVSVRH